MLFKAYWPALGFAVLVALSFVWWSQDNGIEPRIGLLDAGRGEKVPPHTEVDGPAPWWAMVFALLADGTIFASLVFGTLYVWLVAPNWPPPEVAGAGLPLFLALIGYAAAGGLGWWIARANRDGQARLPMFALGAVHIVTAGLVVLALTGMPDPRSHAYAATGLALLGYGVLHNAIGLIFLLNAAIKMWRGLIVPGAQLELRIGSLWHGYTAVTGIAGIALVMAMPALIGMLEGVQ